LTGDHDWRHHLPHRRQIKATNDTTIIELAYEYVFMKRPTFELAGSAGIHRSSSISPLKETRR